MLDNQSIIGLSRPAKIQNTHKSTRRLTEIQFIGPPKSVKSLVVGVRNYGGSHSKTYNDGSHC